MKYFLASLLLIISSMTHAAANDQKICHLTRLSWGGLFFEYPETGYDRASGYGVSGEFQVVAEVMLRAIANKDCDKIEIKSEQTVQKKTE